MSERDTHVHVGRSSPGGSLPARLTSFVGRTAELAQIGELLGSVRVLTLTGSGGCGKTRLAVEAAGEAGYRYEHGVWWVDLEAVTDPERVSAAALAAFGIRSTRGKTNVERVCDELSTKQALVVLDNCEHVLDACAALVDSLLRACPLTQLVATSREPLGVDGEVVWKVPPLAFPDDHAAGVATLMRSDAVRLFVERARSARPDLATSENLLRVVAQICARVDGLPLAIELAAARMRVMTAQQILDGLEDRFRLLTGGVRTAMARQQTLQASVEWSYELLAPADRVLLRRLSVFSGSFTLGAAEEICSDDGLSAPTIFDSISQLVDKSMVTVITDEESGRTRYRLLETIRQFAREELIHAGETAAFRDQHLDHYVRLAETYEPRIELTDLEAFADLEAEHDNLRGALEWALAAGRHGDALRMTAALALFWTMHGHYSEAKTWLERALQTSDAAVPAKARAQWGLAHVRFLGMDGTFGFPDAVQAAEIAEASGDERAANRAKAHLAMLDLYLGAEAGDEKVREAIVCARTAGDRWLEGTLLTVLAFFRVLIRDEVDVALLDELERLNTEDEWPDVMLASLMVSGVVALRSGRLEEARAALERALGLGNDLGDPAVTILAIDALTDVLVAQGNYDASRVVLDEGETQMSRSAPGRSEFVNAKRAVTDLLDGRVTEAHESLAHLSTVVGTYGLPTLTALTITRLGQAEAMLGRYDDARSHLEQALAVARTIGMPWATALALGQRADLARREGATSEAEDLYHEGLAVAAQSGFRPLVAALLEGLAGLAANAESYAEAARLFGAADTMRASMRLVRPPIDAPSYDADVKVVRAALGDEAFTDAWNDGASVSEDDAITYARRARGERKRPTAGWDSLTPAELQVVGLAAQGLSNPEIGKRLFITAGTVKTHLSHVYAKLGIANRAELAAEATRRGVAGVS